jgi:hypothetical protein
MPSEVIYAGAAAGFAEDNLASTSSGVSWGAVFAGGVTAAAVSLILALLGTGVGLASISPWSGQGVGVATFTAMAAVWLVIINWVSSLFGGYMAGRLRTKWAGVHTDEVFFRDTAHGFLAWGVGTLIVAVVLGMVSGSAADNSAHVAGAALQAGGSSGKYFVDELFRQNAPAAQAAAAPAPGMPAPPAQSAMPAAQAAGQAATILAQGAANGGVSSQDQAYLAQLVSQQTGLAPADAQARVNDVLNAEQAAITKAKQAADATRKAASGAAIYSFVALLIGAFIASVAGAIGGRLRDKY